MKNNNKTETPETNIIEQEAALEAEKKATATDDMTLRVTALEEKISAYEEKLNTIGAYLQAINDKMSKNEIEKVTQGDEGIDADKSEEISPSEKILAKNVYELARKDLYDELLPLVECAKKYKNREERDKVIKMMILTEEMADAADKADEMDEIIEKYPALKNSDDMMEKYVTAYVILKGRDACFADDSTNRDKLMKIFESDEELKRAVTEKVCDELKKQNSLPNMSFDGGITSVNIEEKPKNMKAAKDATFRLFK